MRKKNQSYENQKSILKKQSTIRLNSSKKKTTTFRNNTIINNPSINLIEGENNINSNIKNDKRISIGTNKNYNKKFNFNIKQKIQLDIKNYLKTSLDKLNQQNSFQNSFYIKNKKKSINQTNYIDCSNIKRSKNWKKNSSIRKSEINSKIRKNTRVKSNLNVRLIENNLLKFKENIENHYLKIEHIIDIEFNKIKKNMIKIFEENENLNFSDIYNEKNNIIKNIDDNIKNLLTGKESYYALNKFLEFFKEYNSYNIITTNYNKFDKNKIKQIFDKLKTIENNRVTNPDYILVQILNYFESKNVNYKDDILINGGEMIEWKNEFKIEERKNKLLRINTMSNTDLSIIKKRLNNQKSLSKTKLKKIPSKNMIENTYTKRNSTSYRRADRRITSFLKKPLLTFNKVNKIELMNSTNNRSPIIQFIDEDIVFITNYNIIKIFKVKNAINIVNSKIEIKNTKENYDKNLDFNINQVIDIMDVFKNNNNNKIKSITNICVWTREKDNKKILSVSIKSKEILFYSYNPNSYDDHFLFSSLINLSHSVSVMKNYKNSNYLIVGNIKGKIIFIDTFKNSIIKIIGAHKGNISSIGFASDWEYFFTSSGSFSQNHDNYLKIYKLEIIINQVFIKNIKNFTQHHGKNRGILNAKSSNKLSDFIIITNGGSEDMKMSIIDCQKQTKLFDIDLHIPIYNFNCLFGDDLSILVKNYKDIYMNQKEKKNLEINTTVENKINKDEFRIIFASSIDTVYAIIYSYSENKHNSHFFSNIKLSNQNGSCKSTMQIFKIKNNNKYFLLVSNISGSIEYFEIY